MAKTVKEIKEKMNPEAKVVSIVCDSCRGTGRGTPLGFQETTCEKCQGTGK